MCKRKPTSRIHIEQSLLCLILLFMIMPWPINSLLASAANITHLPGFKGQIPFHLETGYVAVDEERGAEYFYYFVESERNPSEDPLLLWLIGGPYCSGFNGLALSMGPIKFDVDAYDGIFPTLVYNPYSWTKISSIIFLDWPVGSGFSFSESAESYASDDISSSKEIYKFFKKWLLIHPHFRSNPIYVGGDSYGGKLVPLVVKYIVEGNEEQQQPPVDIKGYLIGNSLTVERIDHEAKVPHAHGLGIISNELFELIVKNCKGNDYDYPENAHCAANLETFRELLSGLNIGNILEPYCPPSPIAPKMTGATRSMLENSVDLVNPLSLNDTACNVDPSFLADMWANKYLSREALHIKEGSVEKWQHCMQDLNYTYSIPNVVPYHFHLISRGYRALVYSGDHDLIIPFLGTLKWVRFLNFSVMDPWRSWHVGGQVAGYTILFSNNLTFATVKGGSHTPSDNRAKQCFAMFERWMSLKVL